MPIFKTTTCPSCNGKGFTMEYPHYSTIMPERTEKQCDFCHGMGHIMFLPPKLRVIVDRDVECELKAWKPNKEG